jgi:mitogen-activated protein kinase organizer 1
MAIHIGATEIVTGCVDGNVRAYDLRQGMLQTDYIGGWPIMFPLIPCSYLTGPVTTVAPTQDAQSLLISTLDSTARLMDRSNGTMLNTFTGHLNKDYSSHISFGHAEASVLCGDEDGCIWAFDLLNVSLLTASNPLDFFTS